MSDAALRGVGTLALALAFVACASSNPRKSAERHAERGQEYARAGDFGRAAKAFDRSIERAEEAEVDTRTMARLLYEYGRAAALAGDFDAGFAAFDEALVRLQGARDVPSKGLRIATRATKARALFDNARFPEAIAQYDKLIREVDLQALAAGDAADWVAMLDEATEAARAVGDAQSERRFSAAVDSIRTSHNDLPPPPPYPRFTPAAVAARR